jgi:hypothetical protein
VLITLGTGGRVQRRELIAYHAYGVIGLHEDQNGERKVEIVDPGSTPRQSDGVLEEAMGNLGLEGGDGRSLSPGSSFYVLHCRPGIMPMTRAER